MSVGRLLDAVVGQLRVAGGVVELLGDDARAGLLDADREAQLEPFDAGAEDDVRRPALGEIGDGPADGQLALADGVNEAGEALRARQPGQELDRLEEVALPGRVRTDEHGQRRQLQALHRPVALEAADAQLVHSGSVAGAIGGCWAVGGRLVGGSSPTEWRWVALVHAKLLV